MEANERCQLIPINKNRILAPKLFLFVFFCLKRVRFAIALNWLKPPMQFIDRTKLATFLGENISKNTYI